MAKVLQELEHIKLKFRANLLTDNNQDGLLVQSEQDYIACLEIKHRSLEELLRRDAAHWGLDLEKAK